MPNMTCLIVNHENTTWNYYTGRDRAYLLPAAIFRTGGAAVLMSNRCLPERSAPSIFTIARLIAWSLNVHGGTQNAKV